MCCLHCGGGGHAGLGLPNEWFCGSCTCLWGKGDQDYPSTPLEGPVRPPEARSEGPKASSPAHSSSGSPSTASLPRSGLLPKSTLSPLGTLTSCPGVYDAGGFQRVSPCSPGRQLVGALPPFLPWSGDADGVSTMLGAHCMWSVLIFLEGQEQTPLLADVPHLGCLPPPPPARCGIRFKGLHGFVSIALFCRTGRPCPAGRAGQPHPGEGKALPGAQERSSDASSLPPCWALWMLGLGVGARAREEDAVACTQGSSSEALWIQGVEVEHTLIMRFLAPQLSGGRTPSTRASSLAQGGAGRWSAHSVGQGLQTAHLLPVLGSHRAGTAQTCCLGLRPASAPWLPGLPAHQPAGN